MTIPGAVRLTSVFILLTCLYYLGTRFNLDGYELEYVQSARSVFHGDGLALAPGFYNLPGLPDTWGCLKQYPRQHYLQTFATIPFYVFGYELFGEEPTILGRGGFWDLPWGPVATVALVNPMISALTVILVILILRRLSCSEFCAVSAGLIYGLATMTWPYAGLGMEPFQTFVLVLCVLTALIFRQQPTLTHLFVAAFSLILLTNCKKYSIIFLPPLVFYLLINLWRSQRNRFLGISILSLSMATSAYFYMITAAQKLVHNPDYIDNIIQKLTEPGNSVFDIVIGLLVSPGEGLFIFNPILIFALPGWLLFYRKHPQEFGLFLGFFIVWTVAAGRVSYLLIDEEWGSRYLHVLIPFMIIAGAETLTCSRQGLRRVLFFSVLPISIIIQILGSLFLGFKLLDVVLALGIKDMSIPIFTPSLSQPILAGKLFISMIHRYFTSESLTLSHVQYLNYAGIGADQIHLQLNLNGLDTPVGALFTSRWVMSEMGMNVWSEQVFFSLWIILLSLILFILYRIFRSLPQATETPPL